jgi:hypothetical protein
LCIIVSIIVIHTYSIHTPTLVTLRMVSSYVTCITIIDTIILTNYTKDAYYYGTLVTLRMVLSYVYVLKYLMRGTAEHMEITADTHTTCMYMYMLYVIEYIGVVSVDI